MWLVATTLDSTNIKHLPPAESSVDSVNNLPKAPPAGLLQADVISEMEFLGLRPLILPRERSCLSPTETAPEWPVVKGGRKGHDGVGHGQEAEEEHQQQEAHVEVVGAGGLEHAFVGDAAAHHRPALEVHGGQQAQAH